MQRFSYILIVSVVVLLGSWSGLRAQSPIPPTEDLVSPKPEKPELPEKALEVAKEYVEVLQQLQETLQDYVMYIQELDPESRKTLGKSLKRFEKGLQSGTYSENYGKLLSDLAAYMADLAKAQKEVEVGKTAESRELRQLTRSLERELGIINRLVEEDVARKLEAYQLHQEEIAKYVESELPAISIPQFTVTTGENGEIIVSTGKGGTHYIVGSDLPEPPPLPEVTPFGEPSDAPAPRFPGEKGMSRTYSQRLVVTDASRPVYISLKAADITVQESRDDAITATLSVEVAADTRDREKAFFNSTSLIIRGDNTGYHVDAELPTLKDPKTRLLNSRLTVEMPSHNDLILTNTFGEVVVTGLRSHIEVNGHHSRINLTNVDGTTTVANTMGPIELNDVNGSLDITNSYSTIAVRSSSADMSIENSYGAVKVRDTDGEITMKNSGHVEVRSHSGPVKIDNSNGEVQVYDIEGNVYAFNAYQPVTIRNIEGNVKAENANAAIVISDVTGKVRAANRFGQITLTDIAGPIDITNENGAIELSAESGLTGKSYINSSSGQVTINLAAASNLTVEAETLAGQIESTFPMELSDTGERKLAVIKLGEGRNSLDVSATNSSISVKPVP